MRAAVSRATAALARAAGAVLSAPIVAYRRFASPLLPARCKYHPSCSTYALQALRELGPLRGLVVAGWRLARCNPWGNGGYDPIDARRLFRRSGQAEGHRAHRASQADARAPGATGREAAA